MMFASQRASERSCGRLRQHFQQLRSTLRLQWRAAGGAPNPPDYSGTPSISWWRRRGTTSMTREVIAPSRCAQAP